MQTDNADNDTSILFEVFDYGDNIISQAPSFRDFCISCINHIGCSCIPYVKSVYNKLRTLVPSYVAAKMDAKDVLDNISNKTMLNW